MPPFIKLAIEFGPLLAFFIIFKFYGMMNATVAIMIASLISVAFTYYYEKKIPTALRITTIVILVFGAMTLLTGDSTFIKIKPTIINILFGAILLGGLAFNKVFLKNLLGDKLPLTDQAWIIFSKRWAYFFFFLAIFNEIIWRNFSDELWVKFKVFGSLIFFVIFICSQIPFINKHKKD